MVKGAAPGVLLDLVEVAVEARNLSHVFLCVCVCVRERERERECVCVCVYV